MMRTERARARYMEWAKARPHPELDLAGSNLLTITIDEMPGSREAVEFSGPNDNGYEPLLEAIARRYGVTADHVATAPGASGANFLAFAALLQPADDVLVERPGYDPLMAAPELLGARVVRFDRLFDDGYALRPAVIRQAVTPRTRLIVITNSHNPSGVLIDDPALREVGLIARETGARVLVDEVYLDSAFDRMRHPAATLDEVFVSTSSLTKSYGLNGLRCGWVLGSPAVIAMVRQVRGIVDGIGSFPAERLATFAFDRLDMLTERARTLLASNRARLNQFLASRKELEYIPPAAGTVVFPRIRGTDDASPFVERLFDRYRTAVVAGSFFEAPAHFRISFGGKAETLARGLEAIRKALDEGW